jgi:hypothetical protein
VDEATVVKADIGGGRVIQVEVRDPLAEESDVSIDDVLSFEGVAEAIEAITDTVMGALRKAKPDKATVELGLDLALESGALTALIVKGKGSAALTITLEWSSGGAEGA